MSPFLCCGGFCKVFRSTLGYSPLEDEDTEDGDDDGLEGNVLLMARH